MRKYDSKSKFKIFVVSGICLLILGLFLYFINVINSRDKKEYIIGANSVLYDSNKNLLLLENDGIVKTKWNNDYYLIYDDTNISLGKQAVVYNTASKDISVFGTIYKINSDKSVNTLSDASTIYTNDQTSFYKIKDRKYLLVSNSIKNSTESFQTNNYLVVELDKLGNAVLYNDKVNLKTLKETFLVTDLYEFDVALEVLKFKSGEEINLREIIGSSNNFSREESIEESEDSTSGESIEGTGGNASNTGESSNQETVVEEPKKEVVSSITDTRVYQDKNLSIIKNTIGTNYVSIDYSIYDPKSEYKNVYLEIENNTTKEVETYYLAKNGTNIKISGLYPMTKYNIVFKYTYLNGDLETIYQAFNFSYSVTTLIPDTTLNISKIANNKIYYSINEDAPLMESATVLLYVNSLLVESNVLDNGKLSSEYSSYFDLSEYEDIDYIELKLSSIKFQTGSVDTDIVRKVKY